MDIGGAIGGALGSVLGFVGQQQINQKNWDIAQSNNDWSAQQYANRYQTTVKDLQAAGLNPMLAYSQGPGTAPTASSVAPMQSSLGAAVEGYNKTRATSAQAALQTEQLKQVESQVQLNSAQSAKATAEAEVSKEQAELLRKQQPKTEQETKTSNAMMETLMQQGATSAAQAKHYGSLIENLATQNKNLQAELTRLNQSNDQNAPESEIAKKYPTFYYIFHKLMPTMSGSMPNMPRITNVYK